MGSCPLIGVGACLQAIFSANLGPSASEASWEVVGFPGNRLQEGSYNDRGCFGRFAFIRG